MAAVVSFNKAQGDQVYLGADCFGNGAPAATDLLVTDVITYPQGSRYYDLTAHILYTREAITGVVGDFYKSAAGTQAS